MFKIKVTESKVLPEVKLAQPKPFHDYRGEMWTFWEEGNNLLPPNKKFKISKFTRSRKNVLRGLHGDYGKKIMKFYRKDINGKFLNLLAQDRMYFVDFTEIM